MTDKPPKRRRDLDAMVCAVPGCTDGDHGVLYLHGRCHIKAKSIVSYDTNTGILHVVCAVCRKEVGRIAVAE